MSDRCGEVLRGVPIATVFLIFLNVSIHAFVFLFTIDVRDCTLHPRRVLYFYEYYRCISAALLHGGALHILMNMMTLFSLGSSMERKFGSLPFLIFTAWTIVLCGALYCIFSWVMSNVTGNMSYMFQPAVGYSGVLFSYIFVECHHAVVSSRSFFGLFDVPVKVYPWIILVAIQFVMPNISFLGHLSGIVVGLMAVSGIMDLLMPSFEFCAKFETSPCCFNVYKFSNYVPSVDYSLKVASSSQNSEDSTFLKIVGGVKWAFATVWHLISTLLYIIGFPVDSCVVSVSRCYAKVINNMNSFIYANRTSFEIDAPASSNSENRVYNIDDVEHTAGGSIVQDVSGTDLIGEGNSSRSFVSDDIESNRENARQARLLKFAKSNNQH